MVTSPLTGIAFSVAFVAIILAVLLHYDADRHVLALLEWVDEQGVWAPVLFILFMAAVVALVLPGVLFTTGAGFVFGVVEGSLYVVAGTTLGATLAFATARYLFHARARDYVLRHAGLRLIDGEIDRHGWKIVLLTRLIPFFPGKLSNYFFGLTPLPLRDYVAASALGFIPFTVHNVYLGSLAADITMIGTRSASRTPLEWGLYAVGLVAVVIAVLYIGHIARRGLARYADTGNEPTR